MSATSLLPVELWLVILKHVLDFYPFFSLDPAAAYIGNPAAVSDWLRARGWGDEVFQQRLLLRQVCRTWCEFVDRPKIKHRFARLCDTNRSPSASGHLVAVAELLQAQRIEGALYLGSVDHEIEGLKQLREIAASGGTFDVEILTNAGTSLTKFITKTNPGVFPHLKAFDFRYHGCHAGELFAGLSAHFPTMRFLSIRTSKRFNLSHGEGLQLPSLSTLIIEGHISRKFSFNKWSLPSLRHLQIGFIAGVVELQRLITELAVLGPQLRVLGLTFRTIDDLHAYDGYDAQIISQLWNRFPKLESLRFPLYLAISHAPPVEHPIRYITNSDVKPAHVSWRTRTSDVTATCTEAFIAFCLAAPRLVALRECHHWTWDDKDPYYLIWRQNVCQLMAEVQKRLQASNLKVRLEDRNGKTLGEM